MLKRKREETNELTAKEELRDRTRHDDQNRLMLERNAIMVMKPKDCRRQCLFEDFLRSHSFHGFPEALLKNSATRSIIDFSARGMW
jgi:hypothetical protein